GSAALIGLERAYAHHRHRPGRDAVIGVLDRDGDVADRTAGAHARNDAVGDGGLICITRGPREGSLPVQGSKCCRSADANHVGSLNAEQPDGLAIGARARDVVGPALADNRDLAYAPASRDELPEGGWAVGQAQAKV